MDCFGEIVPVPNHSPSSHVMPNVNGLSKVAHSRTFVFRCYCGSENSEPRLALDRLIKFFHIPRITEPSTEVHRVGDFLKKFQKISEIECHSGCSFYFILRLSIDQFHNKPTSSLWWPCQIIYRNYWDFCSICRRKVVFRTVLSKICKIFTMLRVRSQWCEVSL